MSPIIEYIKETTETILKKLLINYLSIDVTKEENDIIRIDIKTDDPRQLLGWHGETLHSLQHIVKSLIWKINDENKYFIIIDTDGYKKRQEENVIRMAETKAKIVIETGQTKMLPPMSPYLRKLVHLYISTHSDYAQIQTESIGEANNRQIKIFPQSSA